MSDYLEALLFQGEAFVLQISFDRIVWYDYSLMSVNGDWIEIQKREEDGTGIVEFVPLNTLKSIIVI